MCSPHAFERGGTLLAVMAMVRPRRALTSERRRLLEPLIVRWTTITGSFRR